MMPFVEPPAQPTAVGIVSFGHGEPDQYKAAVELYYNTTVGDWYWYDIRDKLHDPTKWGHVDLRDDEPVRLSVYHHEDGESKTTQLAVMGQSEYGDCVIELLDRITAKQDDKILSGCRTGYHRAYCVNKGAEEFLNSLHDQHGNRLYNAKMFTLTGRKRYTDCLAVCKEAQKWVRDGGHMLMPTTDFNSVSFYGSLAAQENSFVCEQLIKINSYCETYWPRADPIVEPIAGPVADPTAYIAPAPKMQPTAKRKSQGAVRPQTCPPPPPPASSHSMHDLDWEHEEKEFAEKHNMQPPAKRGKYVPNIGKQIFWLEGPHNLKERPLPEWATLEFNCQHWVNMLTHIGVDNDAQAELFALAQQNGDDGKLRANHCIAKLLKKVSDGEHVWNPSGYMHQAVKSERHEIEQNAEYRRWHSL